MKEKNDIKICVLCVSCNKKLFDYQEMVARNTWIKRLKEESVDVYVVKSGDKTYIDDDIIYCGVPDDIGHTFEKLVEALKQLDEYDYVIKTNLTTYINAKMLRICCQFMKDNDIDIGNGCLAMKDKTICYRGIGLIMNNRTYKFLMNSDYNNEEHLQDDSIFQDIFKKIENLKIYNTPLRYYDTTGYFSKHPHSIHTIERKTLEGVVFINYRIITDINKSNDPNRSMYDGNMRFYELGRCYEIDYHYDELDNTMLSNDLGLIFSIDNNKFARGSLLIQKSVDNN